MAADASKSGKLVLYSGAVEATEMLGAALGCSVRVGDLAGLVGPLGAGKTVLVRGLARALGVQGRVASPSFIVARFHPGPVPLVHADAYRLESGRELVEAGLDEWLAQAVVAVEWADRVAEVLPDDRLTVAMSVASGGRRIDIYASGPRAGAIIQRLQEVLLHGDIGHRDLKFAS
ncbi:MAG: tRNA (adenosine(37)-N6)-threonylcarbamoyltransferase complex ATPase subunit type 1 TsaE [Armatimonadetes bacterium]|nr:tRNA (adenosine(37)-N6)-threonylcarbamoyltransferase complex ATPase subunit type 1 TsaE [Armatimonadota bacterium]